MNTKSVVGILVTGVLGTAAGFFAGYTIAKKRTEALIEVEVQSVKDAFYKRGQFATIEDAVQARIPAAERTPIADAQELIKNNGYAGPTIPTDLGSNYIQRNIFQDGPDDPRPDISQGLPDEDLADTDQDNNTSETTNPDVDEMPDRDPDHPYIVTVDEFMMPDTDTEDKISLTFFEEDEILMDEREQVINNIEETVGEKNLHNFGLGSRDRNTVYVHNERLEVYYEIIRDPRSYVEVVHGEKPERKQGPLRMRDDNSR